MAVLVTGMASCSNKKAAFDYSQDIVAKERSLTEAINKTEDEVERFATAQQFDSVAAVATRMENLVQSKIDDIEKMKVPKAKKADEFRSAALKYFKYIKQIYTAYKEVGMASADDRMKKVEEMQEIATKKDDAIRDMQTAQRAYADANGFKIEK